jgi:hypothetical protein
MRADLLRAFAHVATDGAAGRSPHLVADVLSVLASRLGAFPRLVEFRDAPTFRLTLFVGTDAVRVWSCEATEGRFRTAVEGRGGGIVVFDALRCCAVRKGALCGGEARRCLDALESHWPTAWPSPSSREVWRGVSSGPRDDDSVPAALLSFLDENAFADAVITALRLVEGRWG